MKAIEVKGLTKIFGELKAVDGIDLSIDRGEVFGLLGPNGAGKTTTISMLATLLQPSGGTGKVWGFDVVSERDSVRKNMGIVFQDQSLDEELTGRENLDMHGRMYGMDNRADRIRDVLKLVELDGREDSLVKTYSGGMRRRLEIARGLMHSPKVLFLDEPTLGLDPQTRRRLWDYIRSLSRREEITIILTTHYMEEADYLCDRIGIIDHGKVIALDKPERLKEVLGGDVITLCVGDNKKMRAALTGKYVKKIEDSEITEGGICRSGLNIVVDDGRRRLPDIIEAARKGKIKVESVSLKRPSLEDVFIHYTGRTIREEGADSKEKGRLMMRMRGR